MKPETETESEIGEREEREKEATPEGAEAEEKANFRASRQGRIAGLVALARRSRQ